MLSIDTKSRTCFASTLLINAGNDFLRYITKFMGKRTLREWNRFVTSLWLVGGTELNNLKLKSSGNEIVALWLARCRKHNFKLKVISLHRTFSNSGMQATTWSIKEVKTNCVLHKCVIWNSVEKYFKFPINSSNWFVLIFIVFHALKAGYSIITKNAILQTSLPLHFKKQYLLHWII